MAYTEICKNAIIILLFISASNLLHEFGHYIMCIICGCKVTKLRALIVQYEFETGWAFCKPSLRTDNYCSFLSSSPKKAIVILLSGPFVNLLICLICIVLCVQIHRVNLPLLFGAAYNLLKLIHNFIPQTGGDGAALFKLISRG